LSRFLAGSGLIFRTQQEIRNVHHPDPLVISAGIPANTGGVIAKVYDYNRNTHFTPKVLRFISAKLLIQPLQTPDFKKRT
jgi:hypothetical protein